MTKRILVVEDDAAVADGLVMNLDAEGYETVHVDHGRDAVPAFEAGEFDLVLLDIMLPEVDGLTICRQIRESGARTPVVFLTAKGTTEERIEGLVAGGDDYLPKPFSIHELLARIQGIFRRQSWLSDDNDLGVAFRFDGREIDFRQFKASGPHGTVTLTRRECMVAKYLMERPGEVVSRDELLDAVWGYNTYPTTRTVDNFILKLRKIFEDDPAEPTYFETIRGVGYRFTGAISADMN